MGKEESPEYLRLSLAAAMTLGLRPGLFYRNARLHCVNFLLTYSDGCVGRCSYCGLSRVREGQFEEKSFIRVEWPAYRLEDMVERVEEKRSRVKRMCISMVTNRRASADVLKVTTVLRERLDIPISLLITPTLLSENDLKEFKEAGADRIGVAVDAATEELFEQHRGRGVRGPHRWDKYWRVFGEAVEVFGEGRVGCHLIVGLGETEEEMVERIQMVRDGGGTTHLFSFFPEAGSELEKQEPPPLGRYRRVQLARYLIDEGMSRYESIQFDHSGQIVGFGADDRRLDEVIDSGLPFMTSGCPGEDGSVACNRPYANSLPGPDIRNFPFLPDENDLAKVKEELWQMETVRSGR